MKKWMNRVGAALLAAAAFAMIAGDVLAGEPSRATLPTAQKFYLKFSPFSPGDLQCDATGPGVRTKLSRGMTGTPLLRITGNAAGAQIICSQPDGTRYTTDVNRRVRYSAAGAVWATVTLSQGQTQATVLVERDGDDDRMVPTVFPRAFVKVRQ